MCQGWQTRKMGFYPCIAMSPSISVTPWRAAFKPKHASYFCKSRIFPDVIHAKASCGAYASTSVGLRRLSLKTRDPGSAFLRSDVEDAEAELVQASASL